MIVKAVDALPSGPAVRARGEADPARACRELRCHRPRQDWTPPGPCGRPRRRGPEARTPAGPRRTRLPPGQIPLDRARRSRRSPPQGPRVGRGRRPPQSRAHAADRTGTGGRRTRRSSWSTTRATPAPGCGTPWSRQPSTPWTPTCHPTPTAHPPGSWSPPPFEALTRPGLADDAVNELSVATIRRLACDAEIIPAVLGSKGEATGRRPRQTAGHPRDLGRTGDPRPALRVPRLRPATVDVPRPPHRALDIRW